MHFESMMFLCTSLRRINSLDKRNILLRIIAFLLGRDSAIRILLTCSHGNRKNIMVNIFVFRSLTRHE